MEAENEVFELCQQVYEATGLSSDAVVDFYFDENKLLKSRFQTLSVTKNELPTGYIPLYTSDYLADKLRDYDWTITNLNSKQFSLQSDSLSEPDAAILGETLTLVLLKLTIALSEAGELK